MTMRKQCLLDIGGQLHISHSDCGSMHKTGSCSSQTRSWHDKGDLARSHPPDKELVIDSCWKTESQFLLVS